MNDLKQYFKENTGRHISKWEHYFDVYDRHFDKYRNQEIVILEIGVAQGGSLQMWKHYFGDKAIIYGIDIDPYCKTFEEENVHILIGSQSDRKFLREVRTTIPKVDILIDDGGHTMKQQIVTFEELFPHVKENGVYLCEDLHTSYWLIFGGGFKRCGTFIEYSKNFIDYLNAWHSSQLSVNDFTRSAGSVHYYDSIIVIEKERKMPPKQVHSGAPAFDWEDKPSFAKKTQRHIYRIINATLGILRIKGFAWFEYPRPKRE